MLVLAEIEMPRKHSGGLAQLDGKARLSRDCEYSDVPDHLQAEHIGRFKIQFFQNTRSDTLVFFVHYTPTGVTGAGGRCRCVQLMSLANRARESDTESSPESGRRSRRSGEPHIDKNSGRSRSLG